MYEMIFNEHSKFLSQPCRERFFQQQDDLQLNLKRLFPMCFSRNLSNFRRKFARVKINYARRTYDFTTFSLVIFIIDCCVHIRKLWFQQLSCYGPSKKVLIIPFSICETSRSHLMAFGKRLQPLKGKVLVK